MEITCLSQDTHCDITFRGTFTFTDHPAFRDVLKHIGASEAPQVVLHLGQVDFIDSAALGMLLLALDETAKHHKSLVLSGATGQVKKMLDLSRFNTLFTMQEDNAA